MAHFGQISAHWAHLALIFCSTRVKKYLTKRSKIEAMEPSPITIPCTFHLLLQIWLKMAHFGQISAHWAHLALIFCSTRVKSISPSGSKIEAMEPSPITIPCTFYRRSTSSYSTFQQSMLTKSISPSGSKIEAMELSHITIPFTFCRRSTSSYSTFQPSMLTFSSLMLIFCYRFGQIQRSQINNLSSKWLILAHFSLIFPSYFSGITHFSLIFPSYFSGITHFSLLQMDVRSHFSLLQMDVRSHFSLLQMDVRSHFSLLQMDVRSHFSLLQMDVRSHRPLL